MGYRLSWRELGDKPTVLELSGVSELGVQAMADGLRQSVGISDVHLVEVTSSEREL